MNECKVTIVVGIYNSAEFLEKGLDSIRKQTWSNLEVLLMNDGSTDESGNICETFSKKDSRFITINKKNSGVCASRNMGLDLATGDYVCFMDGDDWLSEDFVEYMMNIIFEKKVKMALSDNVFTTEDRKQIEKDNIEIWDAERTIANIIYPYMLLGPWNKMYSMDLIRKNKIKFPSRWFGETLHFATMVAYYSEGVGIGHRKVYNYRLNNVNSGTTKYNVETRIMSLENCMELREKPFYSMQDVRNAVEWHIYSCHFTLLLNILGTKRKKEYAVEYKEAKRYLRNNFAKVFINSRISVKYKLKLVLDAFFPDLYAGITIKRQEKKIKKILQH